MGRYDGQVVWITGGGTGLGKAMAVEFARQGANVAVSGRRADRLDDAVAAVRAAGTEGLGVVCDVTEAGSVDAAVAEVLARFGRLDVVVANAGFGVMGKFEALTDADWKRQFDTNVFGLIRTVRSALPHLRETGGRVVLLGSVMAYLSLRRNGPYCASKAAVRAIGDTLAAELAGTGVSCTTVHPGFVATEIGQVDNQGQFHADKRDKRPQRVMWPADKAARVIVRAVTARKRELVFTGHGRVAVFLARHFPSLAAFAGARFG